jgi:hypothetical protein
MRIQSQKDFFSGLMFICVGGAFSLAASKYQVGTGAMMGPGYFPLILSGILAILGVAIASNALLSPLKDGGEIGRLAWKPLIFIISANLGFGACIGGLPAIGLPPLGLIFGIYLLTFIAASGGEEFKFREVLVVASLLAIMSYLAFVVLLKLQFPVWPTFFTV